MLDFPRPIIHKNIYIGGLGVSDPKPLDQVCFWDGIYSSANNFSDFQKFTGLMSKGKKGVIIISLGTIAPFHAFAKDVKTAFVKVVRSMPDYHFILKVTKG